MIRLLAAIGLTGAAAWLSWSSVEPSRKSVADPAPYADNPAGLEGGESAPLEDAEAIRATSRARSSLRSEALSPHAMRQLALACVIDDPDCATERFQLAERMSRREGPTQVWLMRLAGERGDYPAFVRHLATATAVRPQAAPVVAQAFAGLLADPQFRTAALPHRDDGWMLAFVEAAASDARLLPHAAQMFDPRGRADLPVRERITATLVSAHLKMGDGRAAARQLAALDPGLLQGITSFSLGPDTLDPRLGPFAWTGQSGSPPHTTGPGQVEITLESGRSGVILARTTVLPAGEYQMRFSLAPGEGAPLPLLSWRMNCLDRPKPEMIWEQPIPTLQHPTVFTSKIAIGSCSIQRWELTGIAAEDQRPSVVRIGALEMRKAPEKP